MDFPARPPPSEPRTWRLGRLSFFLLESSRTHQLFLPPPSGTSVHQKRAPYPGSLRFAVSAHARAARHSILQLYTDEKGMGSDFAEYLDSPLIAPTLFFPFSA